MYTLRTKYVVSDETFGEVQDKLKEWRILPKVKYEETPYYCQGILFDITDSNDGHRMRVKKSEVAYMRYMENFSLNINFFDSMVLQVLDGLLASMDYDTVNKSVRDRIEDIECRASVLVQEIDNAVKKDSELDEKYFVTGSIKNYEGLKRQIELKVKSFEKELDSCREEILRLQTQILEKQPSLYNLDDVQRREIVMEYVPRIYARKLDKWESAIYMETSFGISVSLIYNRKEKTYRFADRSENNKIKVVRSIKGRVRKA